MNELPASEILNYAHAEAARLLRALTHAPQSTAKTAAKIAAPSLTLAIDPALSEQEIAIDSSARVASLRGGNATAVLHAVYTFFQELGCVFESSGELLPARKAAIVFPTLRLRHVPSFAERGIRMHLNFVQDQSHFSEEEFAAFIDNAARQRQNYLMFHMYTPQQWFPFSYRGVEHLTHTFGGKRRPLSAKMIGRNKVKVDRFWFAREFEPVIEQPRALLDGMYRRFQRMMARAHARGIRNCVSMEPEALPPALKAKLGEWTGGDADKLLANKDLNQDWQEGWSGTKLVEPDVRHPLIVDISVERCLQCIQSFPDLDELQLISREGVKWTPKDGESYDGELERLAKKFGFGASDLDRKGLVGVEPQDVGPGMNAQARPYWTVMPGDNYLPTVIGSLRFVEHALAVLSDARVQLVLKERGIATSVAIYSPHPETVRLMMAPVAKMLPKGTRFHCLADYGAKDIAANLPSWKPLMKHGHLPGVITWLEFDGIMALAQGWTDSLIDNIKKASDLGAQTMTFNHWRIRSLEHNAAVASAFTWDASLKPDVFKKAYYGRLFGEAQVTAANKAYEQLETATLFTKSNGYNVGFAGDWVFRTSTNPPGYYWARLLRIAQLYADAAKAFTALATRSAEPGRKQAEYLADLCRISADHVRGVYHLQNAKLPLVGYKAWPLDTPNASWPAPEQLAGLLDEAKQALALEKGYMRTYARWVKTCDEQGQLCSHQQGVIEPYEQFIAALAERLEIECVQLKALKQPLKGDPSKILTV